MAAATRCPVGFFRGRSLTVKVVCATARSTSGGSCCGSVAASPEHAEVVSHNFEAGALLAFFVLPLARLNASFDKNQRTLFEILLGDFSLLAPDDNLVPLGALLALAIAIFVGFVCRDGKIGYSLAAARVAGLGIAAEAADENNFIH